MKIGHGTVIGAGSVVTHDVPKYAIVVGVPAKVLRYRFSQEKIQDYLELAWWNWDEDHIREKADLFLSDD